MKNKIENVPACQVATSGYKKMRTWAQMQQELSTYAPTSFLQPSTATSTSCKSLTAQSQSSSMILRHKSYTLLHTPSNASMMHPLKSGDIALLAATVTDMET